MSPKYLFLFSCCILSLLFLRLDTLNAAPMLRVDRQNLVFNSAMVFGLALPYGQEFMPTFDKVNFVEVLLRDQRRGDAFGTTAGGTFAVNIREDSIDGTVLGTSEIIELPDGFGVEQWKPVLFKFSNLVSLIPGKRTVIEMLYLEGDPFSVAEAAFLNDVFPEGRRYFSGVPEEMFDMYFKVGLVVPEPSTLLGAFGFMLCYLAPRAYS